MKKVLSLLWVALFALPMFTLVSCDKDDDKEEALFKDYSVLIGKTRQGVTDYVGVEPALTDAEYQGYVVNTENVTSLVAWFSYFDGITLDKAVIVQSFLNENLKYTEVSNYLNSKYDFEGIDEDGWYTYTKGSLLIQYIPFDEDGEIDNTVQYLETKGMDTKAGVDYKAIIKAARAAVK